MFEISVDGAKITGTDSSDTFLGTGSSVSIDSGAGKKLRFLQVQETISLFRRAANLIFQVAPEMTLSSIQVFSVLLTVVPETIF